MSDHTPKLDALRKLVAGEIAANPYLLYGFDWCAMPQPMMAAKLGFSVETLRRLISKPPFVRVYREIDGKKRVLVREGVPPPITPKHIANTMSKVWRAFVAAHKKKWTKEIEASANTSRTKPRSRPPRGRSSC